MSTLEFQTIEILLIQSTTTNWLLICSCFSFTFNKLANFILNKEKKLYVAFLSFKNSMRHSKFHFIIHKVEQKVIETD